MTPDNDNIIERFILGELGNIDLDGFHLKMRNSAEFAHEVQLNQDISSSILEQDVMDLRANLHDICTGAKKKPSEQIFFDFAHNLSACYNQDNFSNDISTTENSLQLIHIETHLKCLTERIHQISSKTNRTQEAILSNQISDFIIEEGIKDAILEKDIIALRNNLKEIVSQGYFSFTDFEIDQYLSNELSKDQMLEIDELAENNKKMDNQIKLHEEIDQAIGEKDIFLLRNSLAEIIDDEQQISSNEIKRIDEYLLEYLNEKDRAEYELLMEGNNKLKTETKLNFEINNAIIENDVFKLRSTLSEIITENKQSTKIRKFIPDNLQHKPLRYVGVAASIAAVVSTGLFTLSQQNTSSDKLFQQAYQPYNASGLFRSVPLSNPTFKGIDLYNERKFDEAIQQFAIVLKENNEHPMCNFYSGLCYMEKNSFNEAIVSFQKVIFEKDNLFIEQSEWYLALSFLKTNDEKNAYSILNRIVENNGYYQRNAKELLKKLK